MDLAIKVDLQIYSILIPLVILLYIFLNSEKKDFSSKLFFQIVIVTLFTTIFDIAIWIPNGINTSVFRIINRVGNLAYYAGSPLPLVVWIRYFDFKIFNDIIGLKKRTKYYLITTWIGLLMIAVNYFTGFMYSFSNTNQYIRGPFIFLFLGIHYIFILIILGLAVKYRKKITGTLIPFLMGFFLMPIIGSVFQQFFNELSLTYPLLNITTLVAFIFVVKDTMLKDSLTQLYTRTLFDSRLKYKLKRGDPFTLILYDLNKFKDINDTYGHDAGDEALKTFSAILLSKSKRQDLVCRYGGDEFTSIISSSDHEAGKKITTRVENSIRDYNNKKIAPYKLSTSVGIQFVNSPINMEELLLSVDKKMYANKAHRKKNKRIDS